MAELSYRDAVIRGIAQEMERDHDVVFLGEDIAKAGGVFKATVGLYEQFGPLRVRDTPISEQAIMGAAMGAAMTGPEADRRDHVFGFLRRLLRLYRQRVPQEPLHVQRAGEGAAGRAHRQWRRRALRRAAQPERRELVHDDPRPEGGGAVLAGRRDRSARRRRPRSRSGHLPRAQVALPDQGRGARRRDRRHARHARKFCRPGTDATIARAGADGAARARGGREAQGRARHRLRGDRRAQSSCRSIPARSSNRSAARAGCSRSRRIPRLCGWGAEIVSIVADEAFYDLDGPPVRITTPHIPLPASDILEDLAIPERRRGSSTASSRSLGS